MNAASTFDKANAELVDMMEEVHGILEAVRAGKLQLLTVVAAGEQSYAQVPGAFRLRVYNLIARHNRDGPRETREGDATSSPPLVAIAQGIFAELSPLEKRSRSGEGRASPMRRR